MNSSMLTLYVMNMSELLYSSYKDAPNRNSIEKIIQSDADRAFLYGGGQPKIILTSLPIDKVLLSDMGGILNFRNFESANPKYPTYSLSTDAIHDNGIVGIIDRGIERHHITTLSVIPYGTTPEFLTFVDWLQKRYLHRAEVIAPESVGRNKIELRRYIDRKSGFHELWERSVETIKTPMAFTCRDFEEAIEATRYFHSVGKGCLFKHDTGVSGWGIKLFKYDADFQKMLQDAEQFIKKDGKSWENTLIVVEELIPIDPRRYGGSPSLEYTIDSSQKGKATVRFEYFCEQVLTPTGNFEGILLYGITSADPLIQGLRKAGDVFAQYLKTCGYVGVFDIDFVISKTGKAYAVESNPRRTGGTHVWEVAKHLLGDQIEKYVIYSNDVLNVKKNIKTYSQVRKLIQDLFFGNSREKEGVIISGTNMLHFGKLGYIVFAKSQSALKGINTEIVKRLGITPA